MEIDPEKAHGAAYDTTVTLRCFHVLLERFVDSHGSFDSFEALYDAFAAEVAVAKEAYDIEAAKGHCSIYANTSPTASSPYRFIAGKEAPDPDRTDLIATIPVANRRKAVMDLSKMLTGYDIDVYREVEEEDVALTEFADEIESWIIDALRAAGCDTAKSVLELPVEEIAARADLEVEQAQKVVEILKAEFEE